MRSRHGLRFALAALACLWGGASSATTMTFESTLDFSGSGVSGGRSYLAIVDAIGFLHPMPFDPASGVLLDAEIVVSHMGNDHREKDTGQGKGFKPAELWFLNTGAGSVLGQLQKSQNGWVDQVFTLEPGVLSWAGDSPWALAFRLDETTSGADVLWLDRSVLRGTYEVRETLSPVPEPGTALLLGSGLAALAGIGRRARSRDHSKTTQP